MDKIWDIISPYFSKEENWGTPDAMSGLILIPLFCIRGELGWPFIVHCGTQGKHAQHSYHYKGLAVDGHFVTNIGVEEQYRKLETVLYNLQLSDYMGIGYYKDWRHPGFHIDARGKRVRWWHDKDGYHYFK